MKKRPKIIIALPAYRAEKTLAQTLYEIPEDFAQQILLVDDHSSDRTVAVAKKLGLPVKIHKSNRGYGGNQKTCYDWALKEGAEIVVLLHPDYQYDPKTLPALVKPIIEDKADFTFGSRFAEGGNPLKGGMPFYRYIGNRLLTSIENFVLGTNFSELHSGLKAYRRSFLEKIPYHSYSDKFVFDSQMLIDAVLTGFKIKEVPIPTRYTPDSSSVSIKNSLLYIFQTIRYLIKQSSKIVKANCNLCGGESANFFLIKNGYRIVECQKCGLVFVDYFSSRDPSIYNPTYFRVENSPGAIGYRNYQDAESILRPYFRGKLREIKKFKERGALLDIGCALGFFLDEARKFGFKVQGLEISSFAAKFARQKFNLDVSLGELEKVNFPANHFELVTAFDVIEHLRNPSAFLKEVKRILKKDGFLFIATPDQKGILAKIAGNILYKPPEHLFFFNAKTLREMVEKTGFEVMEAGPELPRLYSLAYFLKSINYHYPRMKFLIRPALKFFIFLHLAEIKIPIAGVWLWLAAKKK